MRVRALLSSLTAVAFAGCGKQASAPPPGGGDGGDGGGGARVAPVPVIDAMPLDAPPGPLIRVAGAYELPRITSTRPLPEHATGFVFVGASGELRFGTTPEAGDATVVDGVPELDALLPGEGTGVGTIGTGRVGTIGAGHRSIILGTAVAAGAEVRLVLIADRRAPVTAIDAVTRAIGGPIAIAVDTGASFATAYPLDLTPTPAGDAGPVLEVTSTETVAGLVTQLEAMNVPPPIELRVMAPDPGQAVSEARRGRRGEAPQARLGTPTVQGELDQDIVRRYLRRNLPRFTYCYEKRLVVQRDLAGTVSATFTIDLQGRVVASQATGVDSEVATCVASAIRTIEFPRPRGDRPVSVTCAISFLPTGG